MLKNYQAFKSSTSTTWTITQPYLAQTVHVCSSHPKPFQNIGTCMQTTCMSYECKDCSCGFIFKSQLESHRKVHLKMAGFVCFKPKCGKCFKRESELNAHLIVQDKKDIKCEHCDYSNPDIWNVHAHSKVHSDRLPYHCPLCQKGFKWQQQK